VEFMLRALPYQALKADVVQSLRSRLTILRDESLNEQEDNTGGSVELVRLMKCQILMVI
jgi:hypothetical protein